MPRLPLTGITLAFGVMALGGLAPACGGSPTTEIVLVIDTNLTIPVDIDHIDVSVAGSQMQPTIGVDLGVAGAPKFPLTLGLTPAGAAGPVTVTVVGSLQSMPVVQQSVATAFVPGSIRMLRMLLLGSCIGTTCPTDETCGLDGCGSTGMPGPTLPTWTGNPPAAPAPATTNAIGGRTVWAGGWHSCANDGTILYCWGQNADGEIGDGTNLGAKSRRPVMNAQDPLAVGLGQFISCVCDRAGQAWCWGRNAEAELGLGSATMANVRAPTQVPGVTDCLQIAGGAQHTCVVRSDHTVSCWGANGSGQAGQPNSTAVVTSPAAVAGLTDVAEVQGGEAYSCVRGNDMTVQCWGDNSDGQLGDGTTTSRSTPARVTSLGADIVELAVGRFFACARHASGQVSCWGGGGAGVLANGGTSMANSSVAVDITAVADATQLAAGLQHVCALRQSGIVSCWGQNPYGQLGDGTTTSSSAPVDVVDITQVTSITAGSVHTCARYAQGLACWGENNVYQVGDGTTTDRWRPASVAGFL